MSLFGSKNKRLSQLEEANRILSQRNKNLKRLCAEKDAHFMGLMADGLRHGSSLAAKYMADRKKFKHGK